MWSVFMFFAFGSRILQNNCGSKNFITNGKIEFRFQSILKHLAPKVHP